MCESKVGAQVALHTCMHVCLNGPNGYEEHLVSISSEGLQVLFYFSSGALSFLIAKQEKNLGVIKKKGN